VALAENAMNVHWKALLLRLLCWGYFVALASRRSDRLKKEKGVLFSRTEQRVGWTKAVAIELLEPACKTRFCDPLWLGGSLFRHVLLLSFFFTASVSPPEGGDKMAIHGIFEFDIKDSNIDHGGTSHTAT